MGNTKSTQSHKTMHNEPTQSSSQEQIATTPSALTDDEEFPMSPSAFRLKSTEPSNVMETSESAQKPRPVAQFPTAILFSDLDDITTIQNQPSSPNVNLDFNDEPIDTFEDTISKTNDGTVIDDVENTLDQEQVQTLILREPPRLDNLPLKILIMILGHVFPVRDTITPWWKPGTLLRFGRGWSTNDEDVTFKPSLDTAFLRVNRACYRIGTDILYGENHFRFHHAHACKWWFRSIRQENISKIKMMTFVMNSGWVYDRRDPNIAPNPSDSSFEIDWFRALDIIYHIKTKLDLLSITTYFWTKMANEPDYSEDEKEELNLYRKSIVDILAKFRDVRKAEIIQVGEQWIGREASSLQLLMQQPGWTRPHEPPVPRMTTRQLLAHCRAERETREAMFRDIMLPRRG